MAAAYPLAPRSRVTQGTGQAPPGGAESDPGSTDRGPSSLWPGNPAGPALGSAFPLQADRCAGVHVSMGIVPTCPPARSLET